MIGTALALLKFVPDLIGLFDSKKGEDAQKTMDVVESVAEAITGKQGDEAVDAMNKDPELAYKFKVAVMADSHVKEQMLADEMKNARDSYKVHHEQADKVADGIMRKNLPTIFILVLINIIAVMLTKYWQMPGEVLAIISNLIGIVVGQLLAERQSIVGFFFGSSLGSKMKNK